MSVSALGLSLKCNQKGGRGGRGGGLNNEGKGKDHCDINLFITKNSLVINLTNFYIVLKMLVPRIWYWTITYT